MPANARDSEAGRATRFLRRALVRGVVAGLLALAAGAVARAQSVAVTFVPTGTTLNASGGTMTFTATFSFPDLSLSALGWTMQAPAGWSYASSAGTNRPEVVPAAGDTETLGWAYFNLNGLAGTAQFTTTLNYPANLTGGQAIHASVNYRVTGDSTLRTATAADVLFASPSTPAATATQISAHPQSRTVAAGATANFSVTATGAGTLTYQWRKSAVAIAGATAATYAIAAAQTADAGNYDVVVSGSGGSVISLVAALTVTPAPPGPTTSAPAITAQPVSVTVAAGGTATFTVGASGTPTPTYQWRKAGAVIAGANGASLAFAAVQAADAGNYDVVVTNSAGSVNSAVAMLTVPASAVAPTITAQPQPQSVAAGATASFAVTASGSPAPTYQWRRNGVAIAGATSATLAIAAAQPADAGNYEVVASNSAGSATSSTATLTVVVAPPPPPPPPAPRLINASVRSAAGAGDDTLIVGLVLGGTGAKQILLRGIGPTLAEFGVGGALADPRLRLFNSGGELVIENDDWGGAASLAAAFGQHGAFALAAASRDAALLVPLRTGAYAAHVTSAAASGVALVEAYEADSATSARIVNLSVRTRVGTGENVLVLGFVIAGSGNKNLLVRGIGPTLAQFGVNGVLGDPQLRLFDAQGRVLQLNDDWAGTAALSANFTQAAAFALPTNSKDAALAASLSPGAYSVEVSGVGATTGVALVELYELP